VTNVGRRTKREVDPLAREPGYLDVLASLEDPGCIACAAANRAARAYLEALLWESVNDAELRPRLREAHGFCREHTGLALRVARAAGAGVGIAILYEDLLRVARAEAESAVGATAGRRGRRRVSDPLRPARRCSACASASATARNCLALLAKAAPDSTIGERARRAEHGICLPHLRDGLQAAEDEESARRLLELFAHVEESLRAELKEFIRKHDYRYANEPRGDEQTSWWRAPPWIVGRAP